MVASCVEQVIWGYVNMVIYKLSKSDNAIYYSHHDMMRLFVLSIKRSGVDIPKNKAGNFKIYFSSATTIGASSSAEFVEIDTTIPAHKLAETLSTYLPDGIKIIAEYDTKSRLNISKISCLAKYEITLPQVEGIQKKITDLLSGGEFKIQLKMNNVISMCDVKSLIHNFYFDKGKFYIISKIGDESLNVVQTINQILKAIKIQSDDFSVHKTNIFSQLDGRYHDIELLVLRNSK